MFIRNTRRNRSPPAATLPARTAICSCCNTSNWPGDAATLRQEIVDYFGSGGTNIEICCTENNSDSSNGGKQLSSLVNGMYKADTLAQLMQTEINSYLWWTCATARAATATWTHPCMAGAITGTKA